MRFKLKLKMLNPGQRLPISRKQHSETTIPHAMNNVACVSGLYRICGQTVYVYKAAVHHLQGVFWCFKLADRDPVEGFRTRKAAIAYAQRSLAA